MDLNLEYDYDYYLNRRYELFSLFDLGIKYDKEGLCAVKPEVPAIEIAKNIPGNIIIDAFTGLGGSAIALAKTGKTVFSIDINGSNIEMARHNAMIYQVQEKITFYEGNTLDIINRLTYDAVYLDPPWGRPKYNADGKFNFNSFKIKIETLIIESLGNAKHVSLTVPLKFDFRELTRIHYEHWVQKSFLLGKPIFFTIHFRP